MQSKGKISFGQQRDSISGQLQILTYSGLLWQLFRSLITGTLEKMEGIESALAESILKTLDYTVEAFLDKAFNLEPDPNLC